MLVTVEGMDTCVRLMQFWNVLSGMLVTLPSVTLRRFVAPENTLLPSVVTELGRLTFVIEVLFANTPESIVVTPDGTVTDPPEPWYYLSLVPSSLNTNPASVVLSACELCEVKIHTPITSARVIRIHPVLVLFFI